MKRSVQGYLATVAMRNASSLLVEGKTDRKVCSRMAHELAARAAADALFVDDVSTIDGFPTDVTGNWQRVEHIAAQIAQSQQYSNISQANGKFRALTDRDTRGFEYQPQLLDHYNGHRVIGHIHHTRGHSIESYFVYFDAFARHILQHFSAVVSTPVINRLERVFDLAVFQSTSLAIAIILSKNVKRLSGAFDDEVWSVDSSDDISLNEVKFASCCNQRQIGSPVVADILRLHSQLLPHVQQMGISVRWFGHGKLVTELLWCSLGAALRCSGFSQSMAFRVATGDVEQKLTAAIDSWLSGRGKPHVEYPDELCKWIALHHLEVDFV